MGFIWEELLSVRGHCYSLLGVRCVDERVMVSDASETTECGNGRKSPSERSS